MDVPETRYARSGDVAIAYQVLGTGPPDLVWVPGFVSNVETMWAQPEFALFLQRVASIGRLIVFDKRGTGLSDRVRGVPTLEERMDDVRAVMDAAGSSRAALLGISEGGPMSILFAATYPERVSVLVLCGAGARTAWAADYPWGISLERHREMVAEAERHWGELEYARENLRWFAPSREGDEEFLRWWASLLRQGASPGAAAALWQMNWEIDVRHVLPAIRVPTLVLHRHGDVPEEGQYIAARIPGARYVELPGDDHALFVGDVEPVLAEIEAHVTGSVAQPEPDRVLATVLFTDIVGSTARAAELGDRSWAELLARHHAAVRRELALHRGREIDTAGDGFFASFEGPARAIRCALAISGAVSELGLETRAGLHTGECELVDGKVGGIAVHIGARVAAEAQAGEVLVSQTVRDLVAGSGLDFEQRGTAELKGVPGEWSIWAVVT